MGEHDEAHAVARAPRPTTQADIEEALRRVGVDVGSVVLVHSSLSRLGWVVGGAQAVVRALQTVLGPSGTIVMPAQTGLSDPSLWEAPPVPPEWWATIRSDWPAFDPVLTPMRSMGVVAECFARLPEVVHSGHPAVGFVAHGPRAAELMHPHRLSAGLGEESPLARLESAGADIVLLGVGHDRNTALHLAEVRALGDDAPFVDDGVPMSVDGERRWIEYRHVDYDEDDFVDVGSEYVSAGGVEQRVPLGVGEVRRLPMVELLRFAEVWLARRRTAAGPTAAPARASTPE